jgi:hypothetical protein
MNSIESWHIIAANLAVGVIGFVITRWHRGLFFGFVGLCFIILPAVFGYFAGRVRGWEAAYILAGVVVLAADLCHKLPERDRVRRKLFRRDQDKNVLR